MEKTIVLKPRVSEKAYAQSQDNVYVFKVDKSVDKLSIARAVEAQFGVTVKTVNTIVSKGKAKRTVRKGGRPVAGRTSDFKKAYVTLKEGDSIAMFASEEEESKETKVEKPGASTKPETKATKEKKSADEAPKTKSRFRRKI
jgi:large subunit ribosomal protein L23